jgi:hypothetical protein
MKRVFEIEWPDDNGPLWMNRDNLLLCLTANCRGTEFTVRDVTGDGNCDPTPRSDLRTDKKLTAKAPADLTMEDCREVAARCWCDPVYERVTMDVKKAELIAKLLYAAASSRRDATANVELGTAPST